MISNGIATCIVIMLGATLSHTAKADCTDGTTPQKAAKSCYAIYQCNPHSVSGEYYVNQKNKLGLYRPSLVFCDMKTRRCGVQGGWMYVTSLDMKRPDDKCPSQFKQETAGGKRVCVKTAQTGCSSQHYSTGGVEYAEVCGKARGYSYGSPDTAPYPPGTYRSIEEAYTDGVSITHGSHPRKHIFTYMGGWTEYPQGAHELRCPCAAKGVPLKYNHFIGNNFYCESGNPNRLWEKKWYLDDPLWDGAGCPTGNSCCSNSGLPYFHRTLPRVTTDNIEVRLCADQPRPDEDIGLEQLELYVR
jgi:hypothetical protein